MKHTLLTFAAAAFFGCLCTATGTRADDLTESASQVFPNITAIHMVADPASPSGYKEHYRWTSPVSDPWTIFYNAIPSFPQATKDADPFLNKTDEFFLLTVNNRNMLQGEDIYLSRNGIMQISRETKDTYFVDENSFARFLGKEQLAKAGYDNLSLPADRDTPGIVVLYNISEQITNPTWLVSDKTEIERYNAFLSMLTPVYKGQEKYEEVDPRYNRLGNYILHLNYPNAPAAVATISGNRVRLSTEYLASSYYGDPKGYFAYYKVQLERLLKEEEDIRLNRKKESLRKAF